MISLYFFYGYKVILKNVVYSLFATVNRKIAVNISFALSPFPKRVRSTVRPIKTVCRSTVDRRQVNGRPSEMMSLYQIISRGKGCTSDSPLKMKTGFCVRT